MVAYDAATGAERWPSVDLSADAEQVQGDVPRYLDVDTTPVGDTLAVGRVVYVASYAGGVFALDAQTGNRVWVNDRATGVNELVLWQQPAHPPRDGVGPEIPARKLLLASSGTTDCGPWRPMTAGRPGAGARRTAASRHRPPSPARCWYRPPATGCF